MVFFSHTKPSYSPADAVAAPSVCCALFLNYIQNIENAADLGAIGDREMVMGNIRAEANLPVEEALLANCGQFGFIGLSIIKVIVRRFGGDKKLGNGLGDSTSR